MAQDNESVTDAWITAYRKWKNDYPVVQKLGVCGDIIFGIVALVSTIIASAISGWWYFVKTAALFTGVVCGVYFAITVLLPMFGIDFTPLLNYLLTFKP